LKTLAFPVLLAGCFGPGPVPAPPSDATIVFVAPAPDANNVCNTSTYVTSLAFGSNSGFAALYPYQPQNNSCNNGNAPSAAIAIRQFPIDGSSPSGQMVAMAGMSSQQVATPQLALGPTGVVAIFDTPSSRNAVAPGGAVQILQNSGDLGFLAGATGLGVAKQNTGRFLDTASPQYPCCGSPGNQQTMEGRVDPLGVSSGMLTLGVGMPAPLTVGELPDAIASNSATTFYVSSTTPGMFDLDEVGSNAPVKIGTVPATSTNLPVGIAADDMHAAWAFAESAQAPPLQPGCQIWAIDLQAPSPSSRQVFASPNLSCLSLAIDPQAVYFAIVETVQPPDCGGCNQVLHGLGLGRVDLTTGMFASIATEFVGAASGPRRVYASPDDPTDIFVLDPLVIAKIPKMAFAGRQDIAP
jgi:hypothetical protein